MVDNVEKNRRADKMGVGIKKYSIFIIIWNCSMVTIVNIKTYQKALKFVTKIFDNNLIYVLLKTQFIDTFDCQKV